MRSNTTHLAVDAYRGSNIDDKVTEFICIVSYEALRAEGTNVPVGTSHLAWEGQKVPKERNPTLSMLDDKCGDGGHCSYSMRSSHNSRNPARYAGGGME